MMTGRELIIYILTNGLEDEPIFKNGKFIGFITAGEAAVKLSVGEATIRALISQKKLEGIVINNAVMIPANLESKDD